MMGAEARSSELFLMEEALEQYNTEMAGNNTAPKAPATNLDAMSKMEPISIVSGCVGPVTKTYQGFGGLKEIENLNNVRSNNPMYFKSADGLKLFQGTFCHSEYYMNTNTTKKEDRVTADDRCTTKERLTKKMVVSKTPRACLGVAEANSTKNSDYKCQYVFADPRFQGKYPNQTEGKYEGFQVSFKSHTNCTAKADSPFMIYFDVKCNPNDDGKALNWARTGDDCSLTFKTESKHGCETMNL
jgi:hypothetical protein